MTMAIWYTRVLRLSKETFLELEFLTFNNIVMLTDEGCFMQQSGLAMLSPLSPFLANAWLASFINTTWMKYWWPLMKIKLTMLYSIRWDIVSLIRWFMDLTVIRDRKDKSETTWFMKPMNTGITLNYLAHPPMKYKVSVIMRYLHWVFNSSRNWRNFHSSMTSVERILKEKSYLSELVL